MELILGLVAGLACFVVVLLAYVMGVRHGRDMASGIVPKVKLNPVRAVLQAVDEHKQTKEQEELDEVIADVMSYTRESALEAVKKER